MNKMDRRLTLVGAAAAYGRLKLINGSGPAVTATTLAKDAPLCGIGNEGSHYGIAEYWNKVGRVQ
jgi:hypothetical protein